MSLHIGNLSSRVRKEELERVFRRFGRCNVQVKDKFGFVVYDYPVNADRALRTLQGKKICGEAITLSWSNRQPRTLQHARDRRPYDLQCGRISSRETYVQRKSANDRDDYRVGFKQPDRDGRKFSPASLPEEETIGDLDKAEVYAEEKDHNVKGDLADEGEGPDPKHLDNDRWDKQAGIISVGEVLEFERYEPYKEGDRGDEDDLFHSSHPGGSPLSKYSDEKKRMVQSGKTVSNHPNNIKSRETCYNCGEVGHRKRDCPPEAASRWKTFSRVGLRREHKVNCKIKGKDGLRKVRSNLCERQREDRDAISTRTWKTSREASAPSKHRQLIRSEYSPAENESCRSQGNEYERRKRRRENGGSEKQKAKKSRGQMSAPVHSDYTASRSGSHPKSASGSASHLKVRSGSLTSSSSRSSHSSRSRNYKSRSRSRSPTSLSLSVSLGQRLPSSLDKVPKIHRDTLAKAGSLASMEFLDSCVQPVEGDTELGDPKLETVAAGCNGSAKVSFKMSKNIDENDIHEREYDTYMAEGTSFRDSLSDKEELTEGRLYRARELGKVDLQSSDTSVSEQLVVPPGSEVGSRSHQTMKSMSITSEEMYKAVKHYGLKHTEEIERDLPVEMFFGSARLWPWEIIYYRRLRKGPISTENYARRIAQNKEFSIVDKYIRSSSGWGELCEDNS